MTFTWFWFVFKEYPNNIYFSMEKYKKCLCFYLILCIRFLQCFCTLLNYVSTKQNLLDKLYQTKIHNTHIFYQENYQIISLYFMALNQWRAWKMIDKSNFLGKTATPKTRGGSRPASRSASINRERSDSSSRFSTKEPEGFVWAPLSSQNPNHYIWAPLSQEDCILFTCDMLPSQATLSTLWRWL